jgi:hypothetical protein
MRKSGFVSGRLSRRFRVHSSTNAEKSLNQVDGVVMRFGISVARRQIYHAVVESTNEEQTCYTDALIKTLSGHPKTGQWCDRSLFIHGHLRPRA